MNLSDILNSKYPSPTKFVGIATSTSGVAYSAASPCEATVICSFLGAAGSGNINVGGLSVAGVQGDTKTVVVNLGTGDSITANASGTNMALLSIKKVN